VGELVMNGGDSWIALEASTNVSPIPENDKWRRLRHVRPVDIIAEYYSADNEYLALRASGEWRRTPIAYRYSEVIENETVDITVAPYAIRITRWSSGLFTIYVDTDTDTRFSAWTIHHATAGASHKTILSAGPNAIAEDLGSAGYGTAKVEGVVWVSADLVVRVTATVNANSGEYVASVVYE
jgi:hypothetical protein